MGSREGHPRARRLVAMNILVTVLSERYISDSNLLNGQEVAHAPPLPLLRTLGPDDKKSFLTCLPNA